MAKTKTDMTAQKKQAVIEQLWLTYYNDTLYAKGLITEEQRNAMRLTPQLCRSESDRQDRRCGEKITYRAKQKRSGRFGYEALYAR